MARSKLEKLLQDGETQAANGQALTQFGLEQITDIARYLKTRIAGWDSTIPDYDPLFEIAKLAILTDKDDIRLRCHTELAKYQYPQIRSLEVQAKTDKEIRVKIEMAGYAQSTETTVEPDEIETEGDLIPEEDEKELPDDDEGGSGMGDGKVPVLRNPSTDTSTDSPSNKQLGTKDTRDYIERIVQESSKRGREL